MNNIMYWQGFFMADGCCTTGSHGRPKIVLELKKEDSNHLVKFKQDLEITTKIQTYTRKLVGPQFKNKTATTCKVATQNPKIVKKFTRLGMAKRNKTSTCKANKAQYACKSFWRGILDGDGCLMYNFSKSKNNYVPRVVLTTGSETLIKQYKEYLQELEIESNYTTRKNGKTFDLKITHRKAHKLVTHLYLNARVSLDRKQEIANKIMAHYA